MSTRKRGGLYFTMVDPKSTDVSTGVDVVLTRKGPNIEHPRARAPEVFTCMTRIAPPTAHLLFDVYMHRDLNTDAAVHASLHAYGAGGTVGEPQAAWDSLVPDPLTLTLLGPGLRNTASRSWAKHAEATRYLFEHNQLDPHEFVGYRLEVDFPVWGADYIMWFDYRRQRGPGSHDHPR